MQIRETIKGRIIEALTAQGIASTTESIVLEHPADLAHGDYATNVALQAFGRIAKWQNQYHKKDSMVPKIHTGNFGLDGFKNPEQLAEKLVATVGNLEGVSNIVAVKPGFINFTLSSQALAQSLDQARTDDRWGANTLQARKKIMVEYTDPNPFKEFHIGHLMSNAVGESISRLLQFSGAEIKRACYQGDVGLHVAKAMWGYQNPDIEYRGSEVGQWSAAYIKGSKAYEQGGRFKDEINALNKKIYERTDPEINTLYDAGRELSLEHFEEIYKVLGTTFDHYFFESDTGTFGKKIVQEHPDVFEKSDGAVVYKGDESKGLHTRVFINSEGMPTYEAKELGLAKIKYDTYPYDTSIVITGNEVNDYFRVLLDAMSKVFPDLAAKTVHISHGMMRFAEGKMSSRTGNVITGESLLNELSEAAKTRAAESRADDHDKLAEQIAVAAIKYQILKQSSGKDIVFDRERALSLEGDSGPYLQYTYARTHAVIAKAHEQGIMPTINKDAEPSEVTRLLHRFPEVVEHAARELEPHIVAQYLLQVASAFNSWYGQEQILDGTPQASHKVAVTQAVNRTLKNGLRILGISAPDKV